MVKENISNAVTLQVRRENKREEQQRVDFDGQAIAQILARKVDKADLDKFHELKANKQEFENVMDLIKTINQQLQQTIIMQNQAVKINITKDTDTKNAHDAKILNLMR